MSNQPLVETAQTEQEMRETAAPWPKTEADLISYIRSLLEREHDYGTAVYAMSLAATAAFNYVAHVEGVTGFQASCADLDFIRRSRGLIGPFALVDGNDMLYPQHDILSKVQDHLVKWSKWAGEEAAKLIAATPEGQVHPEVLAHWKRLAGVDRE